MLLITPGQFQIRKHVCNSCEWLKYIWPFKKTGRICMSYLLFAKKRCEWSLVFFKYYSKYQNESKIVDILSLLPCRSVLLLHSKRENYVWCLWKHCSKATFELPSKPDHWWDQKANICSIKEPFPKEIEEILIWHEYNQSELNHKEGKSHNEGNALKSRRIKGDLDICKTSKIDFHTQSITSLLLINNISTQNKS